MLADPNLPTLVARTLTADLPDALAARVGDGIRWRIETVHEPFEIAASHDRVIDKARARVTDTGWDIAICITDIPIETGNGVVVADVGHHDRVALVSLPALGAVGLHRRAREVSSAIIAELVTQLDGPPPAGGDGTVEHVGTAIGSRLVRRVAPVDRDVDTELVINGLAGRLRLLAGTVRANQPWQLAVGLSTALAAAATGSAFGILYSAIWELATVLERWRMIAGTVTAIWIFVVWLVVGHGLWQRGPRQRPNHLGLLNTATVLTVVTGVLVFYAVLYALNLTAAALIIPPDFFAETIGRPVDLGDYLRVALLASGLGTVAGAVGSGLEDDVTVRRAAYSTREQQRRATYPRLTDA
ncbi:hypothetical protein GCM10009559_17880 [Pseudonocardia zijingensis]|uniref:Uncharacterized protein n=1 Tax=Pseudonocardia zijingensis TaxID=153376 RepID=A0ABN1PMM9_9PSEU